ncbi:MAG TPA: ribonuclease E inhibitor RraB [Candidatus Angelobacter sp.]
MQLFCSFFWVSLNSFGIYQSADTDQLQIEQLAKAGIDMSKPQEITFTLHFPDAKSESKGCVSVFGKKFDVESDRPEKEGEKWTCTAIKTMVPELKALQKIRRDFEKIAADNKGSYDGWKIEKKQ